MGHLGLGHAVLCAERAVGGDPFTVLLEDDFLTDYETGVTADLDQAFAASGKSQLSVMEVDGPDISQYGVVVPSVSGEGIAGLAEKPTASEAPSNLASIGRYVLTPDFFDTLRGLSAGSGGEFSSRMQSTYMRSVGSGNGMPQWPAFRLRGLWRHPLMNSRRGAFSRVM